jgi:hypothetical protein
MEFLDPPLNRSDFLHHVLVENLFTLNASDSRGPAALIDKGNLIRLGEGLVHGEDIAMLGMAGVAPPLPVFTGSGGPQLFPDDFSQIKKPDRIVHRFGHLRLSVRSQDPGSGRKKNLGLRKDLAIPGIELPGNLPRKLHMLNLVLAHGHIPGLVDKDIGRLEHGVVEKTHVDVASVLSSLLLELGHPFQLSNRRHAVEDPGEFHVFGDMGLNKELAPVRSQPAGQEDRGRLQNPSLEGGRLILDGDGMVVDDTVDAIVLIEQSRPIPDRPDIISDVNLT